MNCDSFYEGFYRGENYAYPYLHNPVAHLRIGWTC